MNLQAGDLRHRVLVVQKLSGGARSEAAFGVTEARKTNYIWAKVVPDARRDSAQKEADGVVTSESDVDVYFRSENVELVRGAEHIETPYDGTLTIREVTRLTADGRWWRAGCRHVV